MTDVFIEISKGSNLKYELYKTTNLLKLDRILHTSMSYPGNYGYFPNTLAGDGDPLDVIVLTDYSLQPGTLINCKIIGVLITSDEKGLDEKIIAVPSKSVDNSYCNINDISNVSSITLDKINHFLEIIKYLKKINGLKQYVIKILTMLRCYMIGLKLILKNLNLLYNLLKD